MSGRTARKDYGPVQLASYLGMYQFQFDRARAAGLIPAPDRSRGRWSAGIADAKHRQDAARKVALDDAARRIDSAGAVTAALAVKQETDTRAVLAASIMALPPAQRQVMAWHWDGFSDDEIAAELAMSAAAVRKNRSRAMKSLRRALGTREVAA
jgi:DNA-directed RNA polymerase specialized sigma24 family protein